MEQDKTYMEALLLQQQSMNAQVAEHGGSSPSALQAQLQQLQAEEADLTRRYTDDYPDVIAVRRKIKEVHAKIDATPAPAPTPTAPTAAPSMSTATPNRNDTPNTAQLRAQLRGLEQGLTSKRHEQALIQNQVRLYQDRISSSPAIQEEYKTPTRDYQTAQQF